MRDLSLIFDDIGSYPPPEGVSRKWIKEEIKGSNVASRKIYRIIKDAMWQKIKAGVEVPNYPQFQDMISQFIEPIMDARRTEEPLLIKEEEAKIVEMDMIEGVGKKYEEEKGEKLNVRICVTGPLELYYNKFQPPVYIDILSNIAKSIDRFIKKAIEEAEYCKIKTVSVDEPSVGINPRIEEGIVTALEIASKYAYKEKIDMQIHLHSPALYETISKVKGITVIGMESAATPSFLQLIEKKELERDDKWLRVGISRTDIFNMAVQFNEKYNTNVFKEKSLFKKVISEYNSPEEIKRRLEKAYSIFKDRIKYIGPDCGLGSFPSQELAYMVLKNTTKALFIFRHYNPAEISITPF